MKPCRAIVKIIRKYKFLVLPVKVEVLLIHFNRIMKKINLSEKNKNEKLILGSILI